MDKKLEIIDFKKEGCKVTFYLGKKTEETGWINPENDIIQSTLKSKEEEMKEPTGDDWDDIPYEHNADRVYFKYLYDMKDIYFKNVYVLEPCDGTINSHYSKDMMLHKQIPCIILIPKSVINEDDFEPNFEYWLNKPEIIKIYFGTKIDKLKEIELKYGK